MWQDEAILRKNYQFDWNNSPLHTPTGDNYVLWAKGTYGHQGLYLHKFDNNGVPVWNEDIIIADNGNIKWDQVVISDNAGNLFVYWDEYNPDTGHFLSAVKLNSNGQFLWQPEIISFNVPQMHYSRIQSDNQGGVYIVYGKTVAGYGTNLFCQHISSTGQLILPGNGVQLTNDVNQEDIVFLKPTTDNGLIIGYYVYLGSGTGHRNLQIIRMSPEYQLVWANPIILNQGLLLASIGNITAIDSTQYIISWNESGDTISNSYLQKFDQNGNTFFNPPVLIFNNASFDLGHCLDNNGNIFVSNSISGTNGMLKKYDVNGNSLWTNPVVIADSVFQLINPKPDNLGGCYVLYKLRENLQGSYFDLKLQHVDSSGNLLFTDEGLLLEDQLPYEYHYFYAYSFTDRLYFYWIRQYQDKLGFYFNIRDANGQLLSSPRITISEGLAGDAIIQGMIARDNDLLVYWIDSRYTSGSQDDKRLFYRSVLPDETMSQPEDGIQLADNFNNCYHIQTEYLPNGNTVFIWVKNTGGSYTIMGQALDSNNNILWEPGGRILVNTSPVYSDSRFIVSSEGNDVYIAWSIYLGYDNARTYVQKITDGQAMWGNQGILIDTNHTGNYMVERPAFFQNRFLVIQGQTNHSDNYDWAVHLEPDGTCSTGWLPNGNVLNTYNGSYPLMPDATLLNGNLYVFNKIMNTISPYYYYSVLGADGTVLTSNQLLLVSSWSQNMISFDNYDGLTYSLILLSPEGLSMNVGYSKLTDLTTHPWGDSAVVVYSFNTGGIYNNPSIIGFNNGGYLINWMEGNTISGGYINANGEYQSPLGGIDLINGCKDTYYTAKLGNEVYVAWKDYKAGYYTYCGFEPRVQKLANLSIVHNDDNYLTETTVNSLNCYPNPFNPSTTISFTLAKAGKASLKVYNTKGQLVKTLLNNVKLSGQNKLIWNGLNEDGRQASSGLYFYKLDAPGYSKTCKMMLLK